MDLITLIQSLGGTVWTIVFFVVALSVIVAIHEYGHYIVGRWCGIHAEVFSIGFGPQLTSRTDKRGTVWQVALLPLGGYVRFAGDGDAASATTDGDALEEMTPEERRRTMAGAPLWARSLTVAAGPVFNFISAILLFIVMDLATGVPVKPMTVGELHPLPDAVELQQGDVVLAIDGVEVPQRNGGYRAMVEALPARPAMDWTVQRGGQEITVQAPFPEYPRIQNLQPRSAAADIDLRVGDVITAVNGSPVHAFRELQEAVLAAEGAPLLLSVWRDGTEMEFTLAPRRVDVPLPGGGFESKWLMGIYGGLFFDLETRSPGLWSAVQQGFFATWQIISGSLSGLWHIVTGAISTCNMSGPVGIAQAAGDMASQGSFSFIQFIGVLSVAVGLLNLFPVPVLDGGHLAFYAYEAVMGRPPHEKALGFLTYLGLVLVLSLMAFALLMDLTC